MLDAMLAANTDAPASAAASAAASCTEGLTVAQLMNTLPAASLSRDSSPAKISRIAASSVTTVKITSAAAVTSGKVLAATQPSSTASDVAEISWRSYTAVMGYPKSARRRAMLAPILPTPTNPIDGLFMDGNVKAPLHARNSKFQHPRVQESSFSS